jgi:hypothetical protein
VRTWVTDNREGFAARYSHAREAGTKALADRQIELIDNILVDQHKPRSRITILKCCAHPSSRMRASLCQSHLRERFQDWLQN